MVEYKDIELIIYAETREKFESAKNEYTQIGIIASTAEFWANGSYYPLVRLNDYIKRGEAVDFATDIKGVIEPTSEIFLFRDSAGGKSIRNKSALISSVKGNTILWKQMINGMKTVENVDGATTFYDVNSDEFVVQNISRTSGYTSGSTRGELTPRFRPVIGHKYALVSDKDYPGVGLHSYMLGFKKTNTIFTANGSDYVNFRLDRTFDFVNICPVGEEIRFHLNLFDLTEMFGAGNEPESIVEFKRIYPASHYPYSEGLIRSMKVSAIKTVGFNQFDKDACVGGYISDDTGTIESSSEYSVSDFIRVMPNTEYYLKDVCNGANHITYAFYGSALNCISTHSINIGNAANVSSGIMTPSGACYLRVVVPNAYINKCNVNLRHSRIRDGEFEEYAEYTRSIPEILEYFPDGMNSVGAIFDEIDDTKAIKRLGMVDLGSLLWHSDSSRQCFYAAVDNLKPLGIATCARYSCVNTESIEDKQLSTNNYYGTGKIFVKDSSFENANDFMTGISGVYLVYELKDPVVSPLTTPIQLDYWVDDWGTEEAVCFEDSAQFRADIVYAFNAEGRIRDNSRNIEKLEKTTKPLLGVPEGESLATEEFVRISIPTEVATATLRRPVTPQNTPSELTANLLYDYGGTSWNSITLPQLRTGDSNYENKWMMRVALMSSDDLIIPFDVRWKDGIAPFWNEWVICEITFTQDVDSGYVMGEWKIYK